MNADAPPITAVGIAPPDQILQRFANHFPPQTPYSYVMLRMYEFARLNPRFFLCDSRDQMKIADALRPMKKLTISDLMVFCASPANLTSNADKKFLLAMASCVAEQKENDILDLLGYELDILDVEISREPEYMAALESLHRNLVLYIWLSYRFGTFFRQRPLATHAKRLVEDNINRVLTQFTSVKILDSRFKKLRKRSLGENPLGPLSGSEEQPEPAPETSGTSHRADSHEVFQGRMSDSLKEGSEYLVSKGPHDAERAASFPKKPPRFAVMRSKDDEAPVRERMVQHIASEQAAFEPMLASFQPRMRSTDLKSDKARGREHVAQAISPVGFAPDPIPIDSQSHDQSVNLKGKKSKKTREDFGWAAKHGRRIKLPPITAGSQGTGAEASEEGPTNDKDMSSVKGRDEDRWQDDAPDQKPTDMNSSTASVAQAVVAAHGGKRPKDGKVMRRRTPESDQSVSQIEKLLEDIIPNRITRDAGKTAIRLVPKAQVQENDDEEPTLPSKDQSAPYYLATPSTGLEKDAAPKTPVRDEDKRLTKKNSLNKTTLEILNSLMSKSPSLKQRLEEVRR